jgi:hypothetical protein
MATLLLFEQGLGDAHSDAPTTLRAAHHCCWPKPE